MSILDKLHALFEIHKPLSSGFLAYHTPAGVVPQYRLHLRVEPDGNGILIVNASSVLHLNQTATEMAHNILTGKTDIDNAKLISRRFKVSQQDSLQDVKSFHAQINQLLSANDLAPEQLVSFETHVNSNNLSAPFRLDCYLNGGFENAGDTLGLQSWKGIMLHAYQAGIPHVVLCGGEPTEIDWLIDLIAYTEELGLVTGLVSRGPKLANSDYVNKLIEAGLDHLMVVFDPEDTKLRSALELILPQDLFTDVGLVVRQSSDISALMDWLDKLGANAYSLIAQSEADLTALQRVTDELMLSQHKLITDLPFPLEYRVSNTPDTQFTDEVSCLSLSVDPYGNVFADNSWNGRLGNLLKEDFTAIWSNRRSNQ